MAPLIPCRSLVDFRLWHFGSDLIADVHHDEADQGLGALELLHLPEVVFLILADIFEVAPDGDEIDAVGEPHQAVFELGTIAGPVAKPSEGHGVV